MFVNMVRPRVTQGLWCVVRMELKPHCSLQRLQPDPLLLCQRFITLSSFGHVLQRLLQGVHAWKPRL
jgi:hypothetical protein